MEKTIATKTEQQALNAIATARAHEHLAPMRCSAAYCIKDAVACLEEGNFTGAHQWAKRSLAYSLGILSPVYQDA